MARILAGVTAGFVAWIAVATAGNYAIRAGLPGYAAAEVEMQFTLPMLTARLLLGSASSVLAGSLAAWIGRGVRAAAILGVLLIAVFVPVHVGLWDKFPVWYHLAFVISLLPLTLLGASRVARGVR